MAVGKLPKFLGLNSLVYTLVVKGSLHKLTVDEKILKGDPRNSLRSVAGTWLAPGVSDISMPPSTQ